MADNSRDIDLRAQRDTSAHLLNEYRKKEEYTDVKLQIGDKQFPAHRNILSLHSPVLKAAISEQWSATGICPISEEYVDLEIMEDLLSFLYTGSIKLTPDNVHPICMAAHFLQIPTLLEHSVELLCELITLENVLKLFLFSFSCQLDVLRSSCLRLVLANYKNLFRDNEILEFPFECLKSLILGLRERFWGTDLRKHTFVCVLRWTRENISERLEHLPVLFENIPLVELPIEFLEGKASTLSVVTKHLSCSEIFSNAIANNVTSWKTKDNFIVIGGHKDESEAFSSSMFCYDLHTGTCKKLPNLNEFNYNSFSFSATVVNGRDIVVSGGSYLMPNYTQRLEVFDWFTQTWTSLPTVPYLLSHHAIVTTKSHLYLAGNLKEHRDFWEHNGLKTVLENVVFRYSFKWKQWSTVQLSSLPKSYRHLIPYKSYLYALGTHYFDKYDRINDQWSELKPPNTKWAHIGATLHEDKIYVCSNEGFEVYDLETNLWNSLPAPAVRGGMALVSVNDKLLAVGGYFDEFPENGESDTNLIFEFDLGTQSWNKFGELPSKLKYHRCVVGGFH